MDNQRLLTNQDFFYCYDKELSRYLHLAGYKYIHKARSIADGNIFTVYQRGDELKRLLENYNQQKLA